MAEDNLIAIKKEKKDTIFLALSTLGLKRKNKTKIREGEREKRSARTRDTNTSSPSQKEVPKGDIAATSKVRTPPLILVCEHDQSYVGLAVFDCYWFMIQI